MFRAIADPTRPQPTISTNTRSIYSRSDPLAAPFLAERRGGEDHAARSLLDHVTSRLPHGAVARPSATTHAAPATHARRLFGRQHDRFDAAPARLLDDALAVGAGTYRRRRDLRAFVFLAHALCAGERAPRLGYPRLG